nr:ribonuclease H-like domain-containing protein [Tanacetum cinerariifolium]
MTGPGVNNVTLLLDKHSPSAYYVNPSPQYTVASFGPPPGFGYAPAHQCGPSHFVQTTPSFVQQPQALPGPTLIVQLAQLQPGPNTVVISCFDIIHSDVRTSPIPSLSGGREDISNHLRLAYKRSEGWDASTELVFRDRRDSTGHTPYPHLKTTRSPIIPRRAEPEILSGGRHIDLFNLISAPNPNKVKTETRPRAAHEVPLLTVTGSRVIDMEDVIVASKSSGTPSTIEKLPLDFSNEDQPQTITEGVEQKIEFRTKCRKRGNNQAETNAPPQVLKRDHGAFRPAQRPFYFNKISVSPLPKSYRDAFNDSNWQNTTRDEYTTLIKNKTWTLVPRPSDTNIVRCMWIFRHKYLANGAFSRYKARLVADGSTQLEGVDVDKTFSLVVKPGTIRAVLSLATSRHWPIHQLHVKNAFLHGDLSETVYMHQPLGFQDSAHPDYMYLLHLGSLNYFLGIFVTRDSSGIFLSQKKYSIEILERAGMVHCNSSRTPVDTESKLGATVQQVCLYMHDPREPHFSSLKRILLYVHSTLDFGLQLFSSSTTDLVAYSDRQPMLSRSSAEAEYRGVANGVAETYLVAAGQVLVLHEPSRYQFADIFTKGLPSTLFEEFRTSLSVRCPPAPTAGECILNMSPYALPTATLPTTALPEIVKYTNYLGVNLFPDGSVVSMEKIVVAAISSDRVIAAAAVGVKFM